MRRFCSVGGWRCELAALASGRPPERRRLTDPEFDGNGLVGTAVHQPVEHPPLGSSAGSHTGHISWGK